MIRLYSVTFLDFVMRGWSYNVLYAYRRTTNANDDDDDDDDEAAAGAAFPVSASVSAALSSWSDSLPLYLTSTVRRIHRWSSIFRSCTHVIWACIFWSCIFSAPKKTRLRFIRLERPSNWLIQFSITLIHHGPTVVRSVTEIPFHVLI